MAATERRVDIHQSEFRIMAPALGALLGFELVSAFGEHYPDLPVELRALNFAAVACTALSLVFTLVPTAYHRFAHASDDERFIAFMRRSASGAFAFLAASLVLSLALQAQRSFGTDAAAFAAGVGALAAFAVAWWFVPRSLARRRAELA